MDINIKRFIEPIFESNKKCIVANCSNEYIFCLDTCFKSIMEHIDKDSTYDFLILEDKISKKNKQKIINKYSSDNISIRFEDFDKIFDVNCLYLAQRDYSRHSYYKLLVPDIFKDYDKVLYTDLDMIFQCDINEILNIEIGDYPIAMTRDFPISFMIEVENNTVLRNYIKDNLNIIDPFDYYSAGMVLFNIKNVKPNSTNDCINIAQNKKFNMQEQDILNLYYNKRIFEIPYKYCINTPWIDKFTDEFLQESSYIEEIADAKKELSVLHYSSSKKPWNKKEIDKYDKIWFKYNCNFKYKRYILTKLLNIVYKKEKQGNRRILKFFNLFEFSYYKQKKDDNQNFSKSMNNTKFKIEDLGKNNLFNGRDSFQMVINGDGKFIIKGNNNKVNICTSSYFNNCHIEICGDNVEFTIGKNCYFNNLYAIISGSKIATDKCKITIGDNFINTDDLQIFGGGNKNMDIEIGKYCMFARRIAIYAHDGHNIYDANTNELINIPKSSLKIGDHVWVGHGANILKGAVIPNNTIVGASSVVTKIFNEENTAIAGNPAKIVNRNLRWGK